MGKRKKKRTRVQQIMNKADAPVAAGVAQVEMTAAQVIDAVEMNGKFDRIDAGYTEPTPDKSKACGNCWFFLKAWANEWEWDASTNNRPEGSRCQVVSGSVEWNGNCRFWIGATEQVSFMLDQVDQGQALAKEDAPPMALPVDTSAPVVDEPWDGSAVRTAMTVDQLKESTLAFRGGDTETKGNYVLIYKDTDGNINARAVRAIKAVLGGARGGVDLPAEIRDEVEANADKLMEAVQAATVEQSADPLARLPRSHDIDSVYAEVTGKVQKRFGVSILKADTDQAQQRLVYGVVLAPGEIDAHGDFATAEDIEKACHEFTANVRRIGNQHRVFDIDCDVVESYIAQSDFTMGDQTVTAGSWVLVTKVNDDDLWSDILSGKKTGYSFGGFGVRLPA